jgi:hypothetical protein
MEIKHTPKGTKVYGTKEEQRIYVEGIASLGLLKSKSVQKDCTQTTHNPMSGELFHYDKGEKNWITKLYQ